MIYVPVNSNGHVGTLPPFVWDFYSTLGCHDTQKAHLHVNITTHVNQIGVYDVWIACRLKPLFLGSIKPERFNRNQIVRSPESLSRGTSIAVNLLSKPKWAGLIFSKWVVAVLQINIYRSKIIPLNVTSVSYSFYTLHTITLLIKMDLNT